MDKGLKLTFLQRKYTNSLTGILKNAYITSQQRNANQHHNEISLVRHLTLISILIFELFILYNE